MICRFLGHNMPPMARSATWLAPFFQCATSRNYYKLHSLRHMRPWAAFCAITTSRRPFPNWCHLVTHYKDHLLAGHFQH